MFYLHVRTFYTDTSSLDNLENRVNRLLSERVTRNETALKSGGSIPPLPLDSTFHALPLSSSSALVSCSSIVSPCVLSSRPPLVVAAPSTAAAAAAASTSTTTTAATITIAATPPATSVAASTAATFTIAATPPTTSIAASTTASTQIIDATSSFATSVSPSSRSVWDCCDSNGNRPLR